MQYEAASSSRSWGLGGERQVALASLLLASAQGCWGGRGAGWLCSGFATVAAPWGRAGAGTCCISTRTNASAVPAARLQTLLKLLSSPSTAPPRQQP